MVGNREYDCVECIYDVENMQCKIWTDSETAVVFTADNVSVSLSAVCYLIRHFKLHTYIHT